MANRWFHCLRTWKLGSQEQHKAARLAWAFSCAFESVVSMSQGILGDGLWELEFAKDQQWPQKSKTSQELERLWLDLGVQIKDHCFPPFLPFLSLPSFLFQIYWGLIYVQEMCPWGFTSAHIWTTTRIKGMADSLLRPAASFSLPTLKLSIPQLHRRHKENPTLENFITCLEKLQSLMFYKNCWMY